MIISSSELGLLSKVGGKTLNLKRLMDLGLNVPKFVAIPAPTIKSIANNLHFDNSLLQLVSEDIVKSLGCEKFAVRSSALIEDSAKESFAGQFQTKIDVSPSGLIEAIIQVIAHAYKYLSGDIDKFSIIVQQYIDPDIAGITFTRNPSGGREMIIEFHHGKGEDVVGGRVVPQNLKFYWTDKTFYSGLPDLSVAIDQWKKVENALGFPQDIEWCIKDKEWYFLQARPITTLSPEQYQQNLYLDTFLPQDKSFYYEKTEVCEIAPRPTFFTYDLLRAIYASNGPVNHVYRKYHISYEPRDFLKIVGNELFCDRQEEIKTLFPSHTFSFGEVSRPKFNNAKGLGRAMKNFYFLHRISLESKNTFFENVKKEVEGIDKNIGFREALSDFLANYESIFEANLLAGVALNRLAVSLEREKIPSLAVLGLSEAILPIQQYQIGFSSDILRGNSLEIADESLFVRNSLVDQEESKVGKEWWAALPEWKKKYFKPLIESAVFYTRMREFGRWIVVKKINCIRELLFSIARKNGFVSPKNIYFARLDELLQDNIAENICQSRRNEYLKYSDFLLPKVLSSNINLSERHDTVGVSLGIAKGVLVDQETIHTAAEGGNKILFAKTLSPDLVRYFDDVAGIVAEQGGILSHLSIIARERKMPVIVNFTIGDQGIGLGDKIEINGENGLIKKAS